MARKASQARKRKEELAQQQQQKRQNMMIGGVFAALVLTIAVFALFRQPDSNNESAESIKTAPEVGALAPDFELAGIDGETVRLSDFRGQPVAVTFMHTW